MRKSNVVAAKEFTAIGIFVLQLGVTNFANLLAIHTFRYCVRRCRRGHAQIVDALINTDGTRLVCGKESH